MARRRRERGNVRRKRSGLQAYVRVAGVLYSKMFPADTPRETWRAWIDATVDEPAAGTLAADVEVYLATLADRPKREAERRVQLAYWIARFPKRPRRSITAVEIRIGVADLLNTGRAASTVRHYLTALHHLWSTLDGRAAPNPLRDVPRPRQPAPLPRAIPYPVIEGILAEFATHRHGKLDAAALEQIRTRCAAGEPQRALARAFGVTDAAVSKIIRGARKAGDPTPAKTAARLRVLAYTGIPPAQIGALQRADIDWQGGTVLVRPRRKGAGAPPRRHPLTAAGLAALEAFAAVDAFGPFNTSSAHHAFRRAVDRYCRRLEDDPATHEAGVALRVQLADVRPYDLRHSFLTAVYAVADRSIVQAFGSHADPRTSDRYTLAGVAPAMRAAVEALNAAGFGPGNPGNETGNIAAPQPSTTGQKRPSEVHADSSMMMSESPENV